MGVRGDKWDGLNTRLLWCYLGPLPPRGNGRQGVATDYFAWLLLEGEAEFEFNKREKATLHPGEWGFPPLFAEDRVHRFSRDAKLLSLHFIVEWFGWRPLHPFTQFVKFPSTAHPRLEREGRRLAHLCKGFMDYPLNASAKPLDFARQSLIKGAFWNWLAAWSEALRTEGSHPSDPIELDVRLRRMLEVLEKTEFHGDVPYEKLMRVSSLGQVQIDRLFKEKLGSSPKSVLEQSLINRCKARLLSCDIPVKEIAFELGFFHASNFNMWFKRKLKMTPLEYRASGGAQQ